MKHVKSLSFISLAIIAASLFICSCGSQKILQQVEEKTQELYAIQNEVNSLENEVAALRNKVQESQNKVAELLKWREQNKIK